MQQQTLQYAGEVTPQSAWDSLANNKNSYLVDVRTNVEWNFVGVPALAKISKKPILLSFRLYPEMSINDSFITDLSNIISDKSAEIFFLCRTGGRSLEAAILATTAGFTSCFNVTHGFEGIGDANEQRGNATGWKADNLPWQQS